MDILSNQCPNFRRIESYELTMIKYDRSKIVGVIINWHEHIVQHIIL